MQTAELKGEIEIRLARALELLDEKKAQGGQTQSAEYYKAQTELSGFLVKNAQEIIDELVRAAEVRRVATALVGYPDKRIIPWTEWHELRIALGLDS